ncbi:hypothetical protein IKQ02_03590 [bacterium]|nr:hypothetical protein [bacterium]
MILKINNESKEYKDGTTLEAISKDYEGSFFAAKVNNRVRELTYSPKDGSTVQLLDLTEGNSIRIYQATLRYIIAMALHNVYPNENIRFSNSISMSLFAKIVGKTTTKDMLEKLEKEVNRIIAEDYKFERKTYSIEEMKEYYKNLGYMDKVENLEYRGENVHVYECNGYRNYMYSYMTPSSGYIKEFKFILYYPGFMIQFPRKEAKGYIPQFIDEPNFLKTLARANKWATITDSENISHINKKCEDYDELVKYIGVCETRQNHDIEEIGKRVEENIDDLRLIAIAGPSSSGKTTFSKRLEIELLSRNIHPLRISLDNYYLDEKDAIRDEEGKVDWEHIESLNISLFKENITDFLNGKEVCLPYFDFQTREKGFMKPVKLEKDSVIIIEGIHALNSILTDSIPKENIFKIYIVPLIQRNIDNHNPISITDIRLVRRIVRDKNFRNTTAYKTLSSWKSVRNGERKWIYPNMEQADFIFNSELGYELLVLKKYGMESLHEVGYDSDQFINANRILKFLKVYRSIDDNLVPNNSILREFIGGSVFKDI